MKTFVESTLQAQAGLDLYQYIKKMDDYNNGRFISQAEMEKQAA